MPFNASDFRSRMKNGGARANMFECAVNFPAVAGGSKSAQDFSFKCQAAAFPSFSIGNAEAYYFGRRVNFPGDREWQPFQCEVILEEGMEIRNAFEAWQNQLNLISHDTFAITAQYFFTEIVMTHYRKTGNGSDKQVTMRNAWPMDIGELQVAWADNNRILTFPVTFMYDDAVTDQIPN